MYADVKNRLCLPACLLADITFNVIHLFNYSSSLSSLKSQFWLHIIYAIQLLIKTDFGSVLFKVCGIINLKKNVFTTSYHCVAFCFTAFKKNLI